MIRHNEDLELIGAVLDERPVLSRKQSKRLARTMRNRPQSASYLVDLHNTTIMRQTLPGTIVVATGGLSPSGQFCGLSGVTIGASCDLLNCNTFTNLVVTGLAAQGSGVLVVGVQTSDTDIWAASAADQFRFGRFPDYRQRRWCVWLRYVRTVRVWSGHPVRLFGRCWLPTAAPVCPCVLRVRFLPR